MSDRTTKVTLIAQVSQYLEGMEKAARATRETGTEAERLAQKKAAFEGLGKSALVFGALAAAGLVLAIAKFAEFDEAMSQVKAATQETASNMVLLREAALDAGAETAFSATEAANAIEELGKAGLTTEQILSGGLDGALTLAAAGGIGVAEAAGYAAVALKQFGLEGSELPHVADLLAAGAGKAVGDVSDLAQALNQAGLVANGAGQSIEDTTGVLAAFADAGLIGSDAGTSLKSAIIALQAPTDKSREVMEKYKLSFYDGSGAMLSYSQIAGQLETKLGTLDDETRNAALAQIFGNDALRSANVLYKEGADGIQGYVDQTNDAGYAAKVAADRMDNLNGDLEKLAGSFDTALIRSGSGANDVLRNLVQTATFLVDVFGELPQPVLDAGLAAGALAAAVALTGGAALLAVPKWATFTATLSTMNVSLGTAAVRTVAMGGALAIAGGYFAFFAAKGAEAKALTAGLRDTLDQATGATTKYTRAFVERAVAENEWITKSAKDIGVTQAEIVDALMEGGDALDVLKAKFAAQNNIVDFFNGSGVAAGNASQSIRELGSGLESAKEQFESSSEAGNESAEVLATLEGAADSSAEAVEGLADAIRGFASLTLDSREAERQFQQAIDDVTKSIEDNGTTLDLNTEEGRRNEAALDALAEATLNRAAALYEETHSQEGASAAISLGRTELINQLAQYGITGAEAEAYADKLGLIPSNISTVVDLETAAASMRLQNFVAELQASGLYGTGASLMWSPPNIFGSETGNFFESGVKAFAAGGFPSGIYAGGQNIHKFAETGLPWEAYISPKPGHERENIGYALESLSRLGFGGSTTQAPAPGTGVVELGPKSLKIIRDTARSEVAAYLAASPQDVAAFANHGNGRRASRGGR